MLFLAEAKLLLPHQIQSDRPNTTKTLRPQPKNPRAKAGLNWMSKTDSLAQFLHPP
jgi:hypothetical protein